ncbi:MULTISPECIES: ABC transporter substrate-binding protein [unclassified Microbacterium]|uniref:ABC transporter substrate-binding protein n=1 Tax=unclassified Microbacterium TaxID=2609290 RepID=UPI0012F9AA26|nr:sugar ABC transporter substrate-binding protein [Microbacterium sp. MAH-37]MVQ41371.1 extracellular solute-binding protein [Microbacterium sp. MAH-37]
MKAAALIGVATLALAGCSSAAPGAGGSSVEQDEKATLEIWTRTTPGSPSEAATKRQVEAFEKATGYKAEVTAIFDDFETKLAQRAGQRDLPDIVLNDVSQLGTMQTQGILREIDLDEITNAKDLTKQALEAGKAVDGKTYGIPYSAQANALYVNKEWLDKLGLEAPTNWDELVAVAEAFTKQDPDGNGKDDTYGLAVPGSTKRGYASWYFSNFLWAAGGDFITPSGDGYKPSMTTPESVEATTWFRGLQCDAGVMQPGAASMDTPPTNETFESGVTGMYLTGPYMMPRFDGVLGADKYEIVTAPKGPKDSSVLAEGGTVYLMAGSENEKGQTAFADWYVSPKAQEYGMEGTEAFAIQLPVNTKVKVSDVRDDPRWTIFEDAYQESGHYAPTIPSWTPVRQMTADTINALLADCSLDVEDELTKLDGKLTAELLTQGILDK